jgi:hypothetical protein
MKQNSPLSDTQQRLNFKYANEKVEESLLDDENLCDLSYT